MAASDPLFDPIGASQPTQDAAAEPTRYCLIAFACPQSHGLIHEIFGSFDTIQAAWDYAVDEYDPGWPLMVMELQFPTPQAP